MSWSELSFLQWLGFGFGVIAAGLTIWAVIVGGGLDRQVNNAILDASRLNDCNKAAEDAAHLGRACRDVYGAFTLALFMWLLAWSGFNTY